MRRLFVAPRAQRDVSVILWHSEDRHGRRAADRYRRLIQLALAQLCDDASPPSSRDAGTGGLRLFALRFAARRLEQHEMVRSLVHVIAYRFDDDRIGIVRVLHEAMDPPRHLESALAT